LSLFLWLLFVVSLFFHRENIEKNKKIEKIWRGTKYEQNGRDQLASYLETRGKNEGYLVTFDFSKNKPDVEPQWIEHNGKRIYETIIWF